MVDWEIVYWSQAVREDAYLDFLILIWVDLDLDG